MANTYLPYLMTIAEVRDETPDVKSFRLEFQDEAVRESFRFKAGQFALYSVFGQGECVFCIASPDTRPGYVECSFSYRWGGKVTTALGKLGEGDTVGFRGPYGNWFPIDRMKGKNLVFIGGGIGMAPIRSIFETCLDQRAEFGDILLLNGARSVADMVYKPQMEEWIARPDITCIKTVDPGARRQNGTARSGSSPRSLRKWPSSKRSPRPRLRAANPDQVRPAIPEKLGFAKEQVYTTLENRMKCGIGQCGRCNVGGCYVCKDGPVFSAAELDKLPPEF